MSRQAREESPTGLYHVMVRGAGRQILFEDKWDYKRYVDKLAETKTSMNTELIAYCLMNNHVHMLIKANDVKLLGQMMRKIGTSYAAFYNKKYDHCGNVFQGRYLSKNINDESQLLRCVRYIHNNPVKANFGRIDEYPWSSYDDYVSGGGITDTGLVLSTIGGKNNFIEYSRATDESDVDGWEMDDVVTIKVGNEIIKNYMENQFEVGTIVKKLSRKERDSIICSLRRAGLSNRQIELITGVSREVVKRVH